MEEKLEKPGYSSLRRFRASVPGASYFVTANLDRRGRGLEAPKLRMEIERSWRRLETDGFWSVRTMVVMPDHLHLLITLVAGPDLAAGMRLFKGRATPALRSAGIKWQEGFYEHRLREWEDTLPIFLYIYLNPYCAGLLLADQPWPGYYCAPDDWKWFGSMTRASMPQPEWLR